MMILFQSQLQFQLLPKTFLISFQNKNNCCGFWYPSESYHSILNSSVNYIESLCPSFAPSSLGIQGCSAAFSNFIKSQLHQPYFFGSVLLLIDFSACFGSILVFLEEVKARRWRARLQFLPSNSILSSSHL